MAGRLVITLEIVTPLFLGGTDATSLADTIRVPAIRGQLRYWLRALLGRGYNRDIGALQKQEGYLMGNTETGSPVRLSVMEPKSLLVTAERMMLPHRQLGDKHPLRTQSFAEAQVFQLVISPRPGLSDIPSQLTAALLLWLNLGGLGKRSRRGFGSLQVREVKVEGVRLDAQALKLLQAQLNVRNGAELQAHIEKVVNWCVGTVPETAVFSNLAPYPILSNGVANVIVCKASPDNGELAKRYQQAMIPFWVDILRNETIGLKDDHAYGHADNRMQVKRRASPLHLHIAKTSDGFHLISTTFWSEPDPKETNPKAGWKKVSELLTVLTDPSGRWQGKVVWGRKI
jgi:CRISPR-associated protein Cmr1